MKKFALLLLALTIYAAAYAAYAAAASIPAFAGGYVDNYIPVEVAAPEVLPQVQVPHNPPVPPAPIETRVIEKFIEKPLIKQYGFTLGIVGDYATLGYSRPDNFIELGVKQDHGLNSILAKAGGLTAADLRVGLAINPNSTGQPTLGFFAGKEVYLAGNTLLAADIFVWGGQASILPLGQFSAKVVL